MGGIQGQNRTREIRPSGIVGGLAESWAMVEMRTHFANRKSRDGNPPPKVARAVFLSRH